MTPQILPVVIKRECVTLRQKGKYAVSIPAQKAALPSLPLFPTIPWGREQSPRF